MSDNNPLNVFYLLLLVRWREVSSGEDCGATGVSIRPGMVQGQEGEDLSDSHVGPPPVAWFVPK